MLQPPSVAKSSRSSNSVTYYVSCWLRYIQRQHAEFVNEADFDKVFRYIKQPSVPEHGDVGLKGAWVGQCSSTNPSHKVQHPSVLGPLRCCRETCPTLCTSPGSGAMGCARDMPFLRQERSTAELSARHKGGVASQTKWNGSPRSWMHIGISRLH